MRLQKALNKTKFDLNIFERSIFYNDLFSFVLFHSNIEIVLMKQKNIQYNTDLFSQLSSIIFIKGANNYDLLILII